MKRILSCIAIVSVVVMFASCGSNDTKSKEQQVDQESVAAINEMLAHQAGQEEYSEEAKLIIKAYEEDKTTISIKDLDMKDTTYATMAKILYIDEKGGKLAVVYGLRREKMGIAILQKEGGEAIRLPQTKSLAIDNNVYSNGTTTITTNGAVLTLESKGKKETYKKIES